MLILLNILLLKSLRLLASFLLLLVHYLYLVAHRLLVVQVFGELNLRCVALDRLILLQPLLLQGVVVALYFLTRPQFPIKSLLGLLHFRDPVGLLRVDYHLILGVPRVLLRIILLHQQCWLHLLFLLAAAVRLLLLTRAPPL